MQTTDGIKIGVASYECLPVTQFKSLIERHVENVIQDSELIADNLQKVDRLFKSFDWKAICRQHDRCDASSGESCLIIMISSFRMSLPSPFFLRLLLQALVFQQNTAGVPPLGILNRSQWSPCLHYLLQSVKDLLIEKSSLNRILPSCLIELVERSRGRAECLSCILSIIKYFMGCARTRICFIPVLIYILNQCDIISNRSIPLSVDDDATKSGCSTSIRQSHSCIDQLHNDVSLYSLDNTASQTPYRGNRTPSLRAILERTPVTIEQGESTLKERTLSLIQRKCVNLILQYDYKELQSHCLQALRCFPICIFLRVILLISSRDDLDQLLYQLSSIYGRDHYVYIDMLVDILAEGKQYDLLDTLWDAMSPLREHLEAKEKEARYYLTSFAKLLSYRGKLLMRHPKFSSLVVRLSWRYGSVDDWVNKRLSSYQQELHLHALQFVGILGITTTMDIDKDLVVDQTNEMSLIAGARRLGIFHHLRGFFSTFSATNSVPPQLPCSDLSQENLLISCCPEEVRLQVFSFFSGKRLAVLRLVCRDWKTIADNDSLWRDLYRRRFSIVPTDPLRESHDRWRSYFQTRYRTEQFLKQHLRSSRVRSTQNAKVCPYIGCPVWFLNKTEERWHFSRAHGRSNRRERSNKRQKTQA